MIPSSQVPKIPLGFSSYEAIPQGFSLKMKGRAGYFYFRDGEKVLAVDVEISGTSRCSLVLYDEGLTCYVYPQIEQIHPEESAKILEQFRLWLSQNSISTDLDFPPRPWLPN
jgi:hypothetical protein